MITVKNTFMQNSNFEIIIYQTEDGQTKIDVRMENLNCCKICNSSNLNTQKKLEQNIKLEK